MTGTATRTQAPGIPHLSAADGRAARKVRPRSSLAQLVEDPKRDPVAILSADDADRLAELLPERYRRMTTSPFACYRGSAAVMAHDLGAVPSSGIVTQICGDAHLSNFGAFASPERTLVFDVNDFDETHPGPFEWDVQRLAASAVLAAADIGLDPQAQFDVARTAADGYRVAMQALARRGELEVWYEQVPVERLLDLVTAPELRRRAESDIEKARSRDSSSAARKLAEQVGGTWRFRDNPKAFERRLHVDHGLVAQALDDYGATLSSDRRKLLARFELVDVATKVVGVGSVGTRCLIALLIGHDHGEPLILQLKEAGRSVLEPFTAPPEHDHQGARVVAGQRLMQAASDIFLGWISVDGRDYYWRQMRDMKFSLDLARMSPEALDLYARVCGQVLARAHARSGNRAAIAAYIGGGPVFPDAIARFAAAYADRARSDHALLLDARASGRLP